MQRNILRKAQSFVMAAAVLTTMFTGFSGNTALAETENVDLVKNGDFSQGFRYWDTSKMSAGSFSIVDDYKGKPHALKLIESVGQTNSAADGYGQRVFQVIPVVPGASYSFGYDIIAEQSHNSGPAVLPYDIMTGDIISSNLANNNWGAGNDWTTRNPSTNAGLLVSDSSLSRKVYIPSDVDTVVVSFPRAQRDSYFTNIHLTGPAPRLDGRIKYRNIYQNNGFTKGSEGFGEENTYKTTFLPGTYSTEPYMGYQCIRIDNTASANSGKYFEVYVDVKAGHKYVITYKKSVSSSDGTTGYNVDSEVCPIKEDGTFLPKIASCNWSTQTDYYQMVLGGGNIGSPYGSNPMTIPEGCDKIAVRFFTNGGPTSTATYTDRWADIRVYDVDPEPVSVTSVTSPAGAVIDGDVISATVPHSQTSVLPVLVPSPSNAVIKYYSDDTCTEEISSINNLQYGMNTAYALVIANTGETAARYTVNIHRQYSDECDVTGVISPGNAVIQGTGITATIANTLSSQAIALNVSENASWKLYSDPACTQEIADKTMTSLKVGNNIAYAKVTAQNNTSAKIYTVTLYREPSTACDIRSVSVPESAQINDNVITATVPYASTAVTLNVTVSDNASWKAYSDSQCTNELTGNVLNGLITGLNTCYIKVTAEDNTTSKIYTLNITREQNGEKNIVSVRVPENAVIGTDSVAAQVGVDTGNITVDVTVSTDASWILYSDEACVNAIENKTMTLAYGENTAYIKVTAQNGSTNIYRLSVTRSKSSQKQVLSVVSPSGAIISDKTVTSVTDSSISSVTVDITVSEHAVWELYLDAACTQTAPARKLDLKVGDNTAYIKVTAQDGSTELYTLHVTRSPIRVTGVKLSAASAVLYVGSAKTLKATVSPGDATEKDVTWTTSSNKVATVRNGVVKAVSAGAAVITVKTTDGNFTAKCRITVKNINARSIKLNISSKTLKIKNTYTLRARYTPANTTVKKLKWRSSNEKIAKVSQTGKVTALKRGKTVITAKTVNGKKATCRVTVK